MALESGTYIKDVEERMASVTALEGLRQAVKTKYPK